MGRQVEEPHRAGGTQVAPSPRPIVLPQVAAAGSSGAVSGVSRRSECGRSGWRRAALVLALAAPMTAVGSPASADDIPSLTITLSPMTATPLPPVGGGAGSGSGSGSGSGGVGSGSYYVPPPTGTVGQQQTNAINSLNADMAAFNARTQAAAQPNSPGVPDLSATTTPVGAGDPGLLLLHQQTTNNAAAAQAAATQAAAAQAAAAQAAQVAAQQAAAQQAADFVTGLYRSKLNREPDAGSLATWVDTITSGRMTREQVAQAIATSPERTEPVARALESMYWQVLGRAGDPSEVSYWANEVISERKTLDQVRQEMSTSPERRNQVARALEAMYWEELERPGDANGLAYWANEVISGRTTLDQVRQALRNSPENQAELPPPPPAGDGTGASGAPVDPVPDQAEPAPSEAEPAPAEQPTDSAPVQVEGPLDTSEEEGWETVELGDGLWWENDGQGGIVLAGVAEEAEIAGGGVPRIMRTKKNAVQFIFPNGLVMRFDIFKEQLVGNQVPHINLEFPGTDINEHVELKP